MLRIIYVEIELCCAEDDCSMWLGGGNEDLALSVCRKAAAVWLLLGQTLSASEINLVLPRTT